MEIDLDALSHNLEVIRGRAPEPVGIMLVVKADAYGHGAVQIAHATRGKVDAFAVATVDEARELAQSGIDKTVQIISPVLTDEIPAVVDGRFVSTVPTAEFADAIAGYAEKAGARAAVQIEVDTGMGRAGLLAEEVVVLTAKIAELPALRLTGMFSHFPVAESDRAFTEEQVERFRFVVEQVRDSGIVVPVLHCANSAGIVGISSSYFDMIRPGLLAYGQCFRALLDVQPIMQWKCRVVQVRELPGGSTISYGRTFAAGRSTQIAVLPVGYGHGYPLRLSNQGEVLVAGQRCPVLGRVTMDMTMVDVSDVDPSVKPGDEVVLIGKQGSDEITVDDIANWVGTISYEILTGISKRVARTYFEDGKAVVHKSLLGVKPSETQR